MNFKKIIALTALTCSLAGTTMVAINANASTVNTKNETQKEMEFINPKLAGIFKVTAKSGANIRSGAGTNYKVVATARYGAELQYMGEYKYDSTGTTWYKVKAENNSTVGWICETTGWLG